MTRLVTGHPHLAAAALILVATLAVTWQHLTQGGLFLDDWWVASEARYGPGTPRQSNFGLFAGLDAITGYRPVAVPYFAFVVELVDLDPRLWAAVPVILTGALGLVTYGVLRTARVGWVVAAGTAVLLVTLPFAAVTKYWASGSQLPASMILLLGGWWLGARWLRGSAGIPTALGSFALLAAAALNYEVVVGLVPLAAAYYAAALGGRWKRSLLKTVADCVVVAVALVLGRLGARTDAAPSELWADHARAFVREAWWLGTGGAVPEGGWGLIFKAVVLVGAAALAVRLVRDRDATLGAARVAVRGPLAGAGALMACGVLAVLAGYVVLVPADPWYHPTQPGQGGRVNAIASLGYAIGYAGVAVGVATVLTIGLHAHLTLVRGAVAVVLLALLTVSFGGQSRDQEQDYVKAWRLEAALASTLRATFPDGPPKGSTLMTFGRPGYVKQNIPAFGESWDLNGAVQLIFDDGSLRGFPVLEGQVVTCGTTGVELPLNPARPPLYGEQYGAAYGMAVLVDTTRARSLIPRSRRECVKALATVAPGPYYAPEGEVIPATPAAPRGTKTAAVRP